MARKRVAPFDPPTPAEAAAHPDQVMRGPKSLMWKCAHCGRPASALTVKGVKVCHAHGGSTAAQRDPEVRAQAEAEGRVPPRPPGRPMVTGTYSRRVGVRVDEVLAEYEARGVNPDATDEDMLYLRAYLDVLKEKQPDVHALERPLEQAAEGLEDLLTMILPDEGVTVDTMLDMLERGKEVEDLIRVLSRALKQVTQYTKDIEGRHARLINLSKIRSETRLKDAAARQLDVFTLMTRRFMAILHEQLSSDDYAALMKRVEHDLSEVPASALDGSGGVRA